MRKRKRLFLKLLWLRWRMCTRKIRHARVEPARKHARRLGPLLHVYTCPFCKGWHVGHISKPHKKPTRIYRTRTRSFEKPKKRKRPCH